MAQPSILARTAKGAAWVVAWRMATRVLGLCSTLILVRLLAPEEFGLVALAAAFAASLDICLALGVEEQIIRAKAPDRALYDTAFTINLLRGLLVGGLLVASAVPAATFFGDARLEPILLALAASAALSGLANIGVVDFRRELRFEREFLLQLLPRMVGISVTLGLAFALHSHWALVGGILANRLGIVAMGYVLHPFRPRLSLASWRALAGVSAWSWALSLATTLRDRSDSLVIGRVRGPASLGHYAVGMEVATLPSSELVDPICRACMPGFAANRRDSEDAGAADFLRVLGMLALLTLPAGLGISLLAGPVIALGFGQAWLPAVPVVQVLGVAGVLTLFGNVGAAMLNAHARLGTLLAVTISSAALRIALLLLLTAKFGITGAALAVGIVAVLEHVVTVALALRLLRLRVASLLRLVWRPAMASAGMVLLLWVTGLGWAPPPEATLPAARAAFSGLALGALGYVVVLLCLWQAAGRPQGAETDLWAILRRIRPIRRQAPPTTAARAP